MKPAPPVTTMRRLADINHSRRSVSRGIPLFSPKSSFRWLAEQGSSGLILSSLLKDLSKVLYLAKYGGVWRSGQVAGSADRARSHVPRWGFPGHAPFPSAVQSRRRDAAPAANLQLRTALFPGSCPCDFCDRLAGLIQPIATAGGRRSHGRCARRLTVSDIQLRPGP